MRGAGCGGGGGVRAVACQASLINKRFNCARARKPPAATTTSRRRPAPTPASKRQKWTFPCIDVEEGGGDGLGGRGKGGALGGADTRGQEFLGGPHTTFIDSMCGPLGPPRAHTPLPVRAIKLHTQPQNKMCRIPPLSSNAHSPPTVSLLCRPSLHPPRCPPPRPRPMRCPRLWPPSKT